MQTPEIEVELFERVFVRARRRRPRTLREDFCGAAALAAAWVESDDEREAVGVDLDPEALAWSRKHVLGALEPDERARARLVRRDVRVLSRRAFDVIAAGNFSWAILARDAELAEYFAGARRSLEPDGLLALELFGGRALRRPLVHEHRMGDFTYFWEHERYDASQETLHAAIHFRVGRRTLRRAFRYAFKLRALARVEAMLREAGFRRVALYVEEREARFRRREREPRAAIWNGYLFAFC